MHKRIYGQYILKNDINKSGQIVKLIVIRQPVNKRDYMVTRENFPNDTFYTKQIDKAESIYNVYLQI